MLSTRPRTASGGGLRSRTGVTRSAALAVGLLILVTGCGTRLSHSAIQGAGTGSGTSALTGTDSSGGSGGTTGSSTTGGSSTGGSSTGGLTSGSSTTGGSTTAGSSTGGSSSSGSSTKGSSSTGGATGSSSTGSSSASGSGGSAAAANNTGADAPIFGGKGACTAASGSTVNIGNVSTLSGVLGQLFSPVVPALNTFVKSQNACGGLNGHPIKLFVQDDQDDPSTAASDADDEIQNDHILAFVGNIQVLTIDSMVPVVNKYQVPIVGGDITNNVWFTNPLIYPEGSPPQSISYGFLQAMVQKYHKTTVGDVYCLEVPEACEQIDKAFGELAKGQGANDVYSQQISITATSYTSQCLAAQDKKVQALALIVDAPTQNRFANSCQKVGYTPQYIAYPLGVGNEGQFLGNPNLGNTYVPLDTFPWMGKATPAEQYYQAAVAKYNPGFTTGDAASLGWTSGALLLAGSSKLTANPTSAQFVDGLTAIKGNTLGGLTAPLTFGKNAHPKVPYCLFAAISNSNDSGWTTPVDKPVCSNVRAPSQPS